MSGTQDLIPNNEDEHAPLSITIGVEFEFLLFFCKDAVCDGDAQELVKDVLSEPMTVSCALCGEMHHFILFLDRAEASHYGRWNVTNDSSVSASEEDRAGFDGHFDDFEVRAIEVKSRVLSKDKRFRTTQRDPSTGHAHEISYEQEIAAVLNKLNDHFHTASATLNAPRMLINHTCGFHVHIGNNRLGFPLRTVKNIMTTYIANERVIDALHATDRITGSALVLDPLIHSKSDDVNQMIIDGVYNKPLSSNLAVISYRLRRHAKGFDRDRTAFFEAWTPGGVYPESHKSEPEIYNAALANNVAASVQLVRHAPGLRALKALHSPYHRSSTVNLQNLDDVDENSGDDTYWGEKKMTIEFRQHAGTMKLPEILAWVDFLLCDEEWMSPQHHAIDLLKTLGCSADTITFYREKLGMREAGENSVDAEYERESDSVNPSDVIAPAVRYFAMQRKQKNHPSEVQALIDRKFEKGGYGQFTDGFLSALDWGRAEAGVREKLTIGWRPKTPDAPEPTEDESEWRGSLRWEGPDDGTSGPPNVSW